MLTPPPWCTIVHCPSCVNLYLRYIRYTYIGNRRQGHRDNVGRCGSREIGQNSAGHETRLLGSNWATCTIHCYNSENDYLKCLTTSERMDREQKQMYRICTTNARTRQSINGDGCTHWKWPANEMSNISRHCVCYMCSRVCVSGVRLAEMYLFLWTKIKYTNFVYFHRTIFTRRYFCLLSLLWEYYQRVIFLLSEHFFRYR